MSEAINSYRVYFVAGSMGLEPTIHVAYVQAPKYKEAWEFARAALNKKDGAKPLFVDEGGKTVFDLSGVKDTAIAAIRELKTRNVKLDKVALQAILANPEATAEEKVEAMKALMPA